MLDVKLRMMLACILMALVSSMAFGAAQLNPLINAPEITAITPDGNLSDWQAASDWAVFGSWYNGGLASESRAKYAWNDTADMLYIAVESTESLDIFLEVGGLMGDLTNPSATPAGDPEATQIQFKYITGAIDIYNQLSGTVTGVQAGYTWDGTTMTVEIATPIYSDWADPCTAMNLADSMSVYVYANVADSGWVAADSQSAYSYVNYSGSITMDVASEIYLYGDASFCGDQGTVYLDADINTDCYVNLEDFTKLAWNWMFCNHPDDDSCTE